MIVNSVFTDVYPLNNSKIHHSCPWLLALCHKNPPTLFVWEIWGLGRVTNHREGTFKQLMIHGPQHQSLWAVHNLWLSSGETHPDGLDAAEPPTKVHVSPPKKKHDKLIGQSFTASKFQIDNHPKSCFGKCISFQIRLYSVYLMLNFTIRNKLLLPSDGPPVFAGS